MSQAPWMLPAQWPAPGRVHAFTTLRHGVGVSQAPFDHFNLGSRCGDDADAVASNRAFLVERCGLPSAPRWLRQVHGVEVAGFDAPDVGAPLRRDRMSTGADRAEAALLQHEPEADAAVTSLPGTVLAVLTADCLPVVLAAADGGEVAVAHAGWRGLAAGVLEATVAAMRTDAAAIVAWLGPAAGPQAYEVGADVFETFTARDAQAASAFVATRPGHWRVDLYALARQRLAAAGIAAARVHGGGLCTISDPQRYYSHRRDRRTGRMATLAWIGVA